MTERLHFSPMRCADIDAVLSCERMYPAFVGQWEAERHIEALDDPDTLHLSFLDRDERFMGYAILRGIRSEHGSVELMRVAVVEPGMGYGREIITRIAALCFNELNAHRLWLDVRENNARAQRAYGRIGFVCEGVLRDVIRIGEGEYESLLILSMLRPQWERMANLSGAGPDTIPS